MISIFYDLETTDVHCIGQILNYSFIVVDEAFEVINECSGLIKVDRLQLPSPGAILANKTDLLQHQQIAIQYEWEALQEILRFLTGVLENAQGDVCFVGFNSKKFDLNYLRTSAIRNGLNPYVKSRKGNKLIHCDMLHVLRKLVTINTEFALIAIKEDPLTGDLTRSMTLEHISRQLGLLPGAQSHESRDDVLLTIELAKTILKRFQIDVRCFKSYEGTPFHQTARQGKVYFQRSPEYDLSKDRDFSLSPVTLLDFNGSGALWIDLLAFNEGKGRDSIFWRNPNDGLLFLEEGEAAEQYDDLARSAVSEFHQITVSNFFPRAICDVEQDIFRLSFADREALTTAIWKGDLSKLKTLGNLEVTELYTRHRLKRFSLSDGGAEKAIAFLERYVRYRYGGEIMLAKGVVEKVCAPTLTQYIGEAKNLLEAGHSDTKILESLLGFYASSDIVSLCGRAVLEPLDFEYLGGFKRA